jgi:hypothetical protein
MADESIVRRYPGRVVVSVFLVLLALGWVSAPFVFSYGAMVGASFFGDQPGEDNMRLSRDLTTVALVSFIGFPVVGLVVAAGGHRREAVVGHGVMLVIGVALSAVLGMLSPRALDSRWDSYFPPAPSEPTPAHRPCVNYSGGDAECPGG